MSDLGSVAIKFRNSILVNYKVWIKSLCEHGKYSSMPLLSLVSYSIISWSSSAYHISRFLKYLGILGIPAYEPFPLFLIIISHIAFLSRAFLSPILVFFHFPSIQISSSIIPFLTCLPPHNSQCLPYLLHRLQFLPQLAQHKVTQFHRSRSRYQSIRG